MGRERGIAVLIKRFGHTIVAIAIGGTVSQSVNAEQDFVSELEKVAEQEGLTTHRPGDVAWLPLGDWCNETCIASDHMYAYPLNLKPKREGDGKRVTGQLIKALILRGRAVRRLPSSMPLTQHLLDAAVLPVAAKLAASNQKGRYIVMYWLPAPWFPAGWHSEQ